MNKGELLPFFTPFLGFSRWFWPVPRLFWRRQGNAILKDLGRALRLLTEDHRRVLRLAARHFLATSAHLEIIDIAAESGLTIDRAEEIAAYFDRQTGLITRHKNGSILRAYPLTGEVGRCRLVLSTGVELDTEGALDAIAVPRVMEKLTPHPGSGHLTAACAHCRRPLHFIIGKDGVVKTLERNSLPLVFLPLAAAKTGAEGILFCLRNSVFYCTEDHAREHRQAYGGVRGYYLTVEDSIRFMARVMEIVFQNDA